MYLANILSRRHLGSDPCACDGKVHEIQLFDGLDFTEHDDLEEVHQSLTSELTLAKFRAETQNDEDL